MTAHPTLPRSPKVAFYTVSDARHFVGAVGLINSLRMTGHLETIVVVDVGLSSIQRSLLAGHVELVRPKGAVPGYLAKPLGPLAHPAETVVVLDADVVVIQSLQPLIDRAAEGKLIFFQNDDNTRFFPEWERLGVGVLCQAPYVMSGHIIGPWEAASVLLQQMDDCQRLIDERETLLGGGEPSDPFYYVDQDILNAILMSSPTQDEIVRMDQRLVSLPPFAGVMRVDPDSLRCIDGDGIEPLMLHHALRKPWLASLPHSVYSDVLASVLGAPGAPLKLPPRMIPPRLRLGRVARLDRRRAALAYTLHNRVRGKAGIRRRLARHRRAKGR